VTADRVGAVTAREIYVRTVRVSWRNAGYLLILGALIFVPLGLVDALADRVQEIRAESPSEAFDLGAVALIVAVIVQAATTLLGEVFYAGAVGLALRQGEGSPPPALREVARRLSYGRLIAVDILFGLGTALGLVLLIVPGIVFFGWFALAGPIVEIEDRGVRAAFARSRRLVRGSFRTVVLVLLPIVVASELLAVGLLQLPHLLIHDALFSDWLGESLSNILVSPVYAVAAVLMTLELAARRPDQTRETDERHTSGGEPTVSSRP
jgi:hypothetical protein